MKRPERRGAGEGLGPRPSLLFPRSGSLLGPRPGSRTCALKTHFKVCSRRGGGPLRAGPRTLAPPHGPPTRPRASLPSRPKPCEETGRAELEDARLGAPAAAAGSGLRASECLPPSSHPHRLEKMNGTQSLRPPLRCGLRSSPLFGLVLTPGPD